MWRLFVASKLSENTHLFLTVTELYPDTIPNSILKPSKWNYSTTDGVGCLTITRTAEWEGSGSNRNLTNGPLLHS